MYTYNIKLMVSPARQKQAKETRRKTDLSDYAGKSVTC